MEFKYIVIGEGTPVILLPGLFAGSWIWHKILPNLLLKKYRLIEVSRPFATLENISSIGELGDCLITLLDSLNINCGIIVGNSLGSLVGLELAFSFPKRVKALIISGAPGLGDNVNLGIHLTRTVDQEWLIKLGHKLFHDPSRIENPNDLIEKTQSIFQNRRYCTNILRLLKMSRKYNFMGCLPAIKCPVLLLWGANDQVTPVDEWQKYLYLMQNAQLQVINQCGHSPMIEKPEEFSKAVIQFIKSLPENSLNS